MNYYKNNEGYSDPTAGEALMKILHYDMKKRNNCYRIKRRKIRKQTGGKKTGISAQMPLDE